MAQIPLLRLNDFADRKHAVQWCHLLLPTVSLPAQEDFFLCIKQTHLPLIMTDNKHFYARELA